MSVLVKGMEMPKCCDICPFGYWSNIWQTGACTLIEKKCFADFSVEYRSKRSDNCPLVEVPTPHGRLIDADEMKRLWRGCRIEGSIGPLLDIRPAVIEAEEKDEGTILSR